MLVNFVTYLLNLASHLGYFGIIFIVSLEYACFPIPSEVVLPFIGMGVATNAYGLIYALVASILGGLIGSLICYSIGYIGGVPFLEWTKCKFPKTRKSIVSLNNWFNKYGNLAVLFTRLFPLTRTYVSFLAGSQKLDLLTFLGYSTIGIVIWNTVLISLGYFLGDNLAQIESLLKNYSLLILILLGSVFLFFYRKKIKIT